MNSVTAAPSTKEMLLLATSEEPVELATPLPDFGPAVVMPAPVQPSSLPPRRKLVVKIWSDRVARWASASSAWLMLALICSLTYFLFKLADPSLKQFGWQFLTGKTWDPVAEQFGALPFLVGTLTTSFIALLIAAPFGVGTAIFLTELSPRWARSPIAFIVEMLAAIPSVVYGLVGIFVIAPFMAKTGGPFLKTYLGFLPFFQGPCLGVSILTAALILSVMIVPFITALSREILRTVPMDLKAGSYALGATQWETIWHVVLPYARVGIGGGMMLALGRALGETMAVTMVIGNSAELSASILKPGYSMAAVIANEFREASSEMHVAALVHIGLVLFVVAMFLNLISRWILGRGRGAKAL